MDDTQFYNERLLSNDKYTVFLPDLKFIRRASITGYGYNNGNLMEVLKNDYRQLYDSIMDEEYFIRPDEKFFYLYEIYDESDENIIGFQCRQFKNFLLTKLSKSNINYYF